MVLAATGGRLVTAGCAALALALGLLLFLATGQDDAYIAFWPAHTLLEYGAMLNYSGDRVEQSSSLLYTLVLAAVAGGMRVSVPVAGWWIGIACGLIALFRCRALGARLGWDRPAWLPLALGTLPTFLYWWFGGLETSLTAWLGLEVAILAADLHDGRRRVASAPALGVTAAYAMVRPETMLVLASTLAAWLLLEAAQRRRGAGAARPEAVSALRRWLVLALACQALLIAYRVAAFGSPFPQPVVAKMGASPFDQLAEGLAYYARCALLRPYATTFFAALVAALGWLVLRIARRERPDAALFLLLFVAAQAGMVATAGGDWMRGGRFFAQFAPVVLVAGVGVLHRLRARRRLVVAALALAALSNAAGLALLAFGESSGRQLWTFLARDPLLREYAPELHWSERANRVHTRDLLFLHHLMPRIDEMLAERGTVSILSPQAGMVAYYVALRHFGRIRFIDVHGLTSREGTRMAGALGAGHAANGVQLTPAQLIAALEREGGASARPDLVFDILRSDETLHSYGYDVFLELEGWERGQAVDLGPVRWSVGYSVEQYAAVDAYRWPGFASRRTAVDWDRIGAPR
jgi:hypothetical protein